VGAIDDERVDAEEASTVYDELDGTEEADEASFADELIDDLLPDQFDWRRVVRRYPIPSLLIAAIGGYLLGRSRGEDLVGALGDAAGDHVSSRLGALAEDEFD